ncbi:MAG: 2,4'-dihydroxyacetophenone dioxygenase family protein [Pseudomonadota bacterium]
MGHATLAEQPISRVKTPSKMIRVGDLEWAPFPLEGTFFKPLHLDDDNGRATFLLRVPAGSKADMHKHLAAVEAFVVSGGFSYPGEGSVGAGDYVFEPGGVVHEPAPDDDEDLILFVVAHGPVQGVEPDGTPGGVIDNDLMYQFAMDAGQHHHLR